jgi:hypothetical protein
MDDRHLEGCHGIRIPRDRILGLLVAAVEFGRRPRPSKERARRVRDPAGPCGVVTFD